MKKLLCAAVALLIVVSLAGCAAENPEPRETAMPNAEPTMTAEENAEPEATAEQSAAPKETAKKGKTAKTAKSAEKAAPASEKAGSIVYRNEEFGFDFMLPASWKGYKIVTGKWEGVPIGGANVVESGPMISIRHPKWTTEKPRQDIPIMVFTLAQWNDLKAEKFHIGAAPVGPRELGRNAKYVFALPARYNFSFPEGYEEVEKILNNRPLKTADISDTMAQ